ncbi:MAG: hypothetical protein ACLT98_00875 [Eggerthellaceae bacterium]
MVKVGFESVTLGYEPNNLEPSAYTFQYRNTTRQEVSGMSEADLFEVEGTLRGVGIRVPEAIKQCSGISLYGRCVKSLVFSTDVAVIRNVDADAVLAVYPFTCQPAITQALLAVSEVPVLTGVGGSLTTGQRAIDLAVHSDMQGVAGVVVNASTDPRTIAGMAERVDAHRGHRYEARCLGSRPDAAGARIVMWPRQKKPPMSWRICAGPIRIFRSWRAAGQTTKPFLPR